MASQDGEVSEAASPHGTAVCSVTFTMPRNNTNCLDVKPLGNGVCSGAVVNFCSFYGPLTTRFLHVLSAEYVHFIPYHKMSHSFIINSYYRLKLLNGH